MIDQLIQQLQDSDPDVRRRAILALGKSKDAAALKPLALIVRGDPDPALRDLALKAGQYIRQQQQQQTRPSVAPFTGGTSGIVRLSPKPPPAQEKPADEPPAPATVRFQQLMAEEQRKQEAKLPDPDIDEGISFTIPPLYEGDEPSAPAEQEPLQSTTTIVRGRQYNVPKQDQDRAKQYLDAALSLSIDGDNAKAMKNLTEALSLNPNLINDNYFANIAATVTNLDGEAAAQLIIDRNERKRFTETAERKQKDRRLEQHMSEAKQSTWTDVWFEVIIYALIVIIGPVLAVLVAGEMAKNLVSTWADVSTKLPAQLQGDQSIFTSLSLGTLLPVGIVSGISGVVSLLLQTVLIHYSAKALGGTGTWRHLIQVLLSFYNKWFPVLFLLLYITIAVAFISLLSPIILCFLIILVIMTLYVTSKTSGKIGEAYDFGAAKGCITLLISLLVILLLNAALTFVMTQALSSAFSQVTG